MNRQAMLAALTSDSDPWDIIVIGGGATGLGTALDAASRGYRVALLEAHDFAKGTSSRSTKLIHGGVRYLRQGQVKMVRESLHERGRLRRNAPHIVHSRKFVIPSYQMGGRYYFFAGMKAYDLLAGRLGFEASRLLSTRQTLAALPTLKADGLHGGVAYADGQFDDARLAIALAQTLVEQGGVPINYAPCVRLIHRGNKRGQLSGVVARDTETGNEFELRGRVVVNATGVFGESIMQLDDFEESNSDKPSKASPAGGGSNNDAPRIVASQGTHIVLPQEFLPSTSAMLIPHTDDARVLFAIPWHGRTLFGTTDNRVERINIEPEALETEIDYLLEHAARFLTKQPQRSDILSVFAGLRPLVGHSSKTATSKLSREHEILTSASGLITVIGGKWTTYRKMGQDVVDLAARVGGLPPKASCTAELPLHGASNIAGTDWEATSENPLDIYGSDRNALLDLMEQQTDYATRLVPELPYLTAQVAWAVEHEMARSVEDVLSRRLRALLLDARASMAAAPAVAQLMQQLLQKDEAWRSSQLDAFCDLAQQYLAK
ncbi:MAG: glycerol-3-phosphate dehydrogenase/oxidase [Pirellulaceae bacterium]|nr:glycerol-3-phosphate dehydrogenase/oxidase [Pirellulaceae bacterium]